MKISNNIVEDVVVYWRLTNFVALCCNRIPSYTSRLQTTRQQFVDAWVTAAVNSKLTILAQEVFVKNKLREVCWWSCPKPV